MLFLPLPIIVSMLLMTVLLLLRERFMAMPSGRMFASLLALYSFELLLIGIRWGYGVTLFLPLQSTLAVIWCPLAWLAFRSLCSEGPVCRWSSDWIHLVPILAIVFSILLWPEPIDIILIGTYLVYGIALMRLASKGSDVLRMVRLNTARLSHLALWMTAVFLIVFMCVDILIALDMQFNGGRYSAMVVALANVPSILVLGLAAATAGQARSIVAVETKSVTTLDDEGLEESKQLMVNLESLLIEQQLYKEPELNLQRLARKCGVPTRSVSRAVNLLTDQNVSQWVNEQRIKAACDLLIQSDLAVTDVMYQVGFITKSNFNREFKRVVGTSPSGWRKRHFAR